MAHGLPRRAARPAGEPKTRLRWQAERPGALWHGDVCHVTGCTVGGKAMPIRIHGLLDLKIACARLGITLLHARPYDPQARGKMERFWRTLREGCLVYLGAVASLGDINATLRAFLDRRYHPAPHAGLLGKSPRKVYAACPAGEGVVDEKALRAALTERTRRRVSGDNIVSVDGVCWQLDQGYLAGQVVSVARCFVAPSEPPWVEHEGKHLLLHPVDPQRNARRKRPPCGGPAADKPTRPVDFNPVRTLRRSTGGGEDTSAGGGGA